MGRPAKRIVERTVAKSEGELLRAFSFPRDRRPARLAVRFSFREGGPLPDRPLERTSYVVDGSDRSSFNTFSSVW